MRPGSPPFGKVVLFGAAADVVPKADGGMVSAVPRLALGTPEHLFGVLLLPTVGYSAPYLHHRAFTYLRSVAARRPFPTVIIHHFCGFVKGSRGDFPLKLPKFAPLL
jgi:hypothetical protein